MLWTPRTNKSAWTSNAVKEPVHSGLWVNYPLVVWIICRHGLILDPPVNLWLLEFNTMISRSSPMKREGVTKFSKLSVNSGQPRRIPRLGVRHSSREAKGIWCRQSVAKSFMSTFGPPSLTALPPVGPQRSTSLGLGSRVIGMWLITQIPPPPLLVRVTDHLIGKFYFRVYMMSHE